MELKSKVLYTCPEFTLNPGDCTSDLSVAVSEAKKQQMLNDFPDWFEVVKTKVIEEKVQEEPVKIQTPEDKLKIRRK